MLRYTVLLSSITMVVLPVPIKASAEICDGSLSWLCEGRSSFDAESSSKGLEEARIQRHSASPPCQSREEVHGGNLKYRVIGGRHCWYASTRGAPAKSHNLDVNPHDDPSWKESEASGLAETIARSNNHSRTATDGKRNQIVPSQARNCKEQALKLFDLDELKLFDREEKRMFMKQCMLTKDVN